VGLIGTSCILGRLYVVCGFIWVYNNGFYVYMGLYGFITMGLYVYLGLKQYMTTNIGI
jgi:hypothetical protein